MFQTVKNTVENLKHNATNDFLKEYKLINSKKQPPNLERLLCQSEYVDEELICVKKCGKNCVCCSYIKEAKEHRFKNSDTSFKIKSPFNCESSNLLYVINCGGCDEEYIGQTGRLLKERLVLYRQHISSPQYQTSYCEQHLRNCGKGKFTIFPFFQLKNDNRINRENHESKFIHKFKPTLNRRL